MRNLKKVLSLVLVVAMLASMMIVGAAAAETETTNYPEAAAVISGIGVMEGDENGMRYADTVTREEAAAIICRVLLGDTAETLKTTTAPFADVAASRWSAGYIAYLKAQGIISGVSATEFDPTAKVTGIAFAKMLLTAVGYGKNAEFEGAAWDINTITFANDNGLYEGTKAADLAAPATREECMLYAFNALLIPTVKYNKTFESYYSGASALNPATGADLIKYTLAALKFNLTSEAGVTDYFGRPAANYKIGGEVLASRVVNAEPNFVAENVVTGADLYKKIGAATLNKITTVNVYVDGDVTSGFGKADITLTSTEKVAEQGAHLEAYISGNTLTLVVYYEYFGTMIAAANKTTGVVTLGSDKGIIEGATVLTSYVYTKSAIKAAENTATGVNIVDATVAAPTTGTYTKTDANGLYVIDGTAYAVSSKGTASGIAYNTAYYVYTDSLNNILAIVAVDTSVKSSDYLYVKASQFVGYKDNGTFAIATPASAKLEVIYANGGKAVVDYTITALNGKYYVTLPGSATPVELTNSTTVTPGWYSYVTANDGTVTLVAAAAVTKGSLKVETGKFQVCGLTDAKANSKTVLNIVNKDGEVATYTGIAKFPAGYNAGVTAQVMIEKDLLGNITTINAYIESATLTVTTELVGFCAEYAGQDALGYHYSFYVNGELVDIVSATTLNVGGAYVVNYNTVTGYAAGAAKTTDSAYNATLKAYTNNVITGEPDPTFFTVVEEVNAETPVYTTYYYNDGVMATFIFDLANGGAAGTLTAGRTATVVTYEDVTDHAMYIWLH